MAASCNSWVVNSSGAGLSPWKRGFCGGSIVGGYVYRGSQRSPGSGTYFYGDFCLQFVKELQYQTAKRRTKQTGRRFSPPAISRVLEKMPGELYVVTNLGGVYRIVP